MSDFHSLRSTSSPLLSLLIVFYANYSSIYVLVDKWMNEWNEIKWWTLVEEAKTAIDSSGYHEPAPWASALNVSQAQVYAPTTEAGRALFDAINKRKSGAVKQLVQQRVERSAVLQQCVPVLVAAKCDILMKEEEVSQLVKDIVGEGTIHKQCYVRYGIRHELRHNHLQKCLCQ